MKNDPLIRYLPKARKIIFIASVIVAILFIFSIIVFLKGESLSIQYSPDTEKYSQYGNFIGGLLASIFNFLTFILLLFTYFYQRGESEETRALNTQSLTILKKQNFEDTFFKMLDNLIELIKNTSGPIYETPQFNSPTSYEDGLEYFSKLRKEFINWYFITGERHQAPNMRIDIIKHVDLKDRDELILSAYNDFYDVFFSKHHDRLGHLFRYMHNITKFTETSLVDSEINSSTYINILQSQLSDSFIALLYFNALSNKSKNSKNEFEFRERLDNFNFFENLRKGNKLDDFYIVSFPEF